MVQAPLAGIRIIEIGGYISGPLASMILSDLGADVVKLEQPGAGDPFRAWDVGGKASAIFGAFNRGKRSLAVDLKKPAGQELARRLLPSAHALVENLRPGTLDRLGLGYSTVKELNPKIVYCSVTGTGSTGLGASRPTYDAIAQALSGLWSLMTDMSDPKPIGPPMSDQITGMYAAIGILAALRSGRGQRIELSMLGASMAFTGSSIASYLLDDRVETLDSRPRQSQSYSFIAADGLPLAIHLSSPPKFWEGLVEAVNEPALLDDPRFRTKKDREQNYEDLRLLLAECFASKPRDEWLKLLAEHDVPSAPINTVAEALVSPEAFDNEILWSFGEGDRRIELAGSPLKFAGAIRNNHLPPPRLGENTVEILRELGVEANEIDRLRDSEVI